jgi:hypothetical protein
MIRDKLTMLGEAALITTSIGWACRRGRPAPAKSRHRPNRLHRSGSQRCCAAMYPTPRLLTLKSSAAARALAHAERWRCAATAGGSNPSFSRVTTRWRRSSGLRSMLSNSTLIVALSPRAAGRPCSIDSLSRRDTVADERLCIGDNGFQRPTARIPPFDCPI